MQILVKITIVTTLFASVAAYTAISESDTNTAVFNFGGTVEEICKVKSAGTASASSLVIDSSNTAQTIGTLEVWCNTGRSASTKYASSNNGYLVNGDNQIAYTLAVGDLATDMDLSQAQVLSATDAGSDTKGSAKEHVLKIKPVTTGVDLAGDYSDTITVTVSYN
jgi:spore coat protein U-like protein